MHYMLDLETLDVTSTAVITEVGIAAFELSGEGVLQAESWKLNIDEQFRLGRTASSSTMLWWLAQSADARTHFAERSQEYTLEAFGRKFAELPWADCEGVWANGPSFDIAAIETLFYAMNRKIPWKYYAGRDLRTLLLLSPVEKVAPALAHSAVGDAVAQALTVQRAYRELRRFVPNSSPLSGAVQ